MIGQNVGGRYRVIRVLGEGGMGVVYEGEQQMGSTKRKVAIKTLHPQLSNDPSVSARFHRECGVVAQLEHTNTIKVYDFGSTDNGALYIAMEFLDGDTLTDVIEKAAIEPSRVAKLASQIAGSLGEAHGQGIIHRDLKPDNVLLINRAGESDVVKLLDFGIAARTESADAEKAAKKCRQKGREKDARHAALHEPRAVHRPSPGPAQRYLLPRYPLLRDADGSAAFPGQYAVAVGH